MTILNGIAIVFLIISTLRILGNIAVWTYHHHTRAGRIRQRFNPPKYSYGPWFVVITFTFGWLLQ